MIRNDGYNNIGSWIELAARDAGRYEVDLDGAELTAAAIAVKSRPIMVMPSPDKPRPNALDMFAEQAREAVEAEVIPSTSNATMNVKTGRRTCV